VNLPGGEPLAPNKAAPAQPVVILGGFLSPARLYEAMREALARLTSQPVWIVPLRGPEWLLSVTPVGWAYLLRQLEQTVQRARRDSPTGRVTLIGHSAGGVLGRLYLSPQPFAGHGYRGLEAVSDLITLGSPHYNQAKLTRGGLLSRWVEQRYPGAYFTPQVHYVSAAGQARQGNPTGTLAERWVYREYKAIGGDGRAWGDGLIPTRSALLQGSDQITLEGVGHFVGFAPTWYGQAEVIPTWWPLGRDSQSV